MRSASERIASLVTRGYIVSIKAYGAKIGAVATHDRIGYAASAIERDVDSALDRLCLEVDREEESKDRR